MNVNDKAGAQAPPFGQHSRYTDGRKTVFEEFTDHLDAEMQMRSGGRKHQAPPPSSDTQSSKDQSDAYVREAILLQCMSRAELVARIQALRQNLREMMSPHDYADLMQELAAVRTANTPMTQVPGTVGSPVGINAQGQAGPRARHSARTTPVPDPLQGLREEAKALLDRTYRRYVLLPKVEQQRSLISRRMLIWVGSIAAVLWAVLFLYRHTGQRWLGVVSIAYLTAAIAGSIGATVSTLMRLQKVDTRREPLMLWMSLEQGSMSLWLSPILGALFGLLFLLLMRSGLVSGSLFPNFTEGYWHSSGLHMDLGMCPGNALCGVLYRDYTWLIIWTFAAGWAERLVPDVLNRLTTQTLTYVRDSSK